MLLRLHERENDPADTQTFIVYLAHLRASIRRLYIMEGGSVQNSV